MKNFTKYDWLLILSVPLVAIYCWVAMIVGVANNRPFGSGDGGWFGSFPSILLGFFLFLIWAILVLVRVVTLSHEIYKELTMKEKEVIGRVAQNATKEFLRRMKRRKDRIGKVVRIGDKLTKGV